MSSLVYSRARSPFQNIVVYAHLLALEDHRPESVAAICRIRHALTARQGHLHDLLTTAPGNATQLPTQAQISILLSWYGMFVLVKFFWTP